MHLTWPKTASFCPQQKFKSTVIYSDGSIMYISVIFMMYLIAGNCGRTPTISEHPKNAVVAKGFPVTLKCKADGDPEPKVTWWKDGTRVVTAHPDNKIHRVLLPSGFLFFLKAVSTKRESDSGTYWCEATNIHGTARSQNATLTVAGISSKLN